MHSAEEKYRVTLQAMSLADMPFRMLTQMFWRPQAFAKAKTNQSADESLERKVDQLNKRWQQQEVWVNQAVDAILGASPPPAIGELTHRLMPNVESLLMTPFECRTVALKRQLGVPDLFLAGAGQAVAGEIKIGATGLNGKYSFKQYTKYLSLALFLRASRRHDLPRRVTHLLIVPTLQPEDFIQDFDQWKPEIRDGWLIVNPKSVRYADRKNRFDVRRGWTEEVLAVMRNKKYAAQNEIDVEEVAAIEKHSDFGLVQTRVVTWTEFADMTYAVARGHGLEHFAPSCIRLKELGGHSSPDAQC